MSCGRPAYVYDDFGTDGWVTPAAYPAMEADGFAGQALEHSATRERLRDDLAAYDPAMGIVGAVVITVWAWGLVRQTSRVLLDREMDAPVVREIREVIEDGEAVVVDLHVWRVGPGRFACIVGLVTDSPQPPEVYKERLRVHEELVHITVEVHQCEGEHPHVGVPAGAA